MTTNASAATQTKDVWASALAKPLLTPEEEYALATRAHRGDEAAAQQLCERNLGLAMHFARKYAFPFEDFDELRQIAAIAILKSARKFNPDLGAKFSSYATQAIQHAFVNYRDSTRPGGFSVDEAQAARQHVYRNAHPDPDRLAIEADMTPLDAQTVLAGMAPLSLDAPVGHDDGTQSLGDHVAAYDAALDAVLDHDDHATILRQMFGLLPRAEVRVLALRYGIATTHAHTLEEAGTVLGASTNSVRLLERQAMDRLQGRRAPRPPRLSLDTVAREAVRA